MVCVLSNVFISIYVCSMLNVWYKTKCDLLLYGLHALCGNGANGKNRQQGGDR